MDDKERYGTEDEERDGQADDGPVHEEVSQREWIAQVVIVLLYDIQLLGIVCKC